MKTLIASVLFITAVGTAGAADMQIPWADGSGGTESNHIAAVGQDLNYQHQKVTKSNAEGTWADASGSISADEQALTSTKPAVVADPKLMPHQG